MFRAPQTIISLLNRLGFRVLRHSSREALTGKSAEDEAGQEDCDPHSSKPSSEFVTTRSSESSSDPKEKVIVIWPHM